MIQKLSRTIAFILLAAFTAPAAEPYLPFIGPPPLRFVHPEPPATIASNQLAADSLKIPAPKTNAQDSASHSIATAPVVTAPRIISTDAASEPTDQADGSTPKYLMLSQQDLAAINPGMLVDYFKPIGNGTNGAAIVAPVKIGFTPPVPSTTRSRATYTTK